MGSCPSYRVKLEVAQASNQVIYVISIGHGEPLVEQAHFPPDALSFRTLPRIYLNASAPP